MTCNIVPTLTTVEVGPQTPGDWWQITFVNEISPATYQCVALEPNTTMLRTLVQDTDWELHPSGQNEFRLITTSYDPPTGTIIQLSRCTSLNRTVTWQAGSTLTADDHNLEDDQAIYIDQELAQGLVRALGLNLRGDCWDAQGKRVCNSDDAQDSTDLTTLRQVQALLAGGEIAPITGATRWFYTSAGESQFALPGVTGIDPDELFVVVNGVTQNAEPGESYTVLKEGDPGYPGGGGGEDYVEFVNPTVPGDKIEIRLFEGAVRTVLGDAAIDSDSLADGVLEKRHFTSLRAEPGMAEYLVLTEGAEPLWTDATSIALITPSLNTWLAAKKLSAFTAPFIDDNLDMSNTFFVRNMPSAVTTDHAVPLRQLPYSHVARGSFTMPTGTGPSAEVTQATSSIGPIAGQAFRPDVVHLSILAPVAGNASNAFSIVHDTGATSDEREYAVSNSGGEQLFVVRFNGNAFSIYRDNSSTGVTAGPTVHYQAYKFRTL